MFEHIMQNNRVVLSREIRRARLVKIKRLTNCVAEALIGSFYCPSRNVYSGHFQSARFGVLQEDTGRTAEIKQRFDFPMRLKAIQDFRAEEGFLLIVIYIVASVVVLTPDFRTFTLNAMPHAP